MPNTDTPPDEAMQKAQKLLESTAERPYRSHSQPACVPCRRRKSRCQMEAGAKTCVTCHAHRTECYLPGAPQDQAVVDSSARRQRKSATRASSQGSTSTARTALPTSSPFRASNLTKANTSRMPLPGLPSINHQPAAPGQMVSSTAQEEEFSLALVSADDQHPNLHIVGPAGTNDSQVLSDYLSGIPGAARLTRMVTPESVRSRPVLFTEVQKRPVGISMNRSTSADRLETIEKLLEPYTEEIIDESVLARIIYVWLDNLTGVGILRKSMSAFHFLMRCLLDGSSMMTRVVYLQHCWHAYMRTHLYIGSTQRHYQGRDAQTVDLFGTLPTRQCTRNFIFLQECQLSRQFCSTLGDVQPHH